MKCLSPLSARTNPSSPSVKRHFGASPPSQPPPRGRGHSTFCALKVHAPQAARTDENLSTLIAHTHSPIRSGGECKQSLEKTRALSGEQAGVGQKLSGRC